MSELKHRMNWGESMSLIEERVNQFFSIPFAPQGAIFRAPARWARSLGIETNQSWPSLPVNAIDRYEVGASCRNTELDVLFGYVLAMAWGNQGAGPSRQHALSAWEDRDRIADALDQIRKKNIARSDAYDLFCGGGKIQGLGPSYFTKLLFFFSPSSNRYIMDQWTAKSVNYLCGREVVLTDSGFPSSKNTGKNYEAFCSVIDELACRSGGANSGEQIEQRLFSYGGKNPGEWRAIIRAQFANTDEREQAEMDEIWVESRTLSKGNKFYWFLDENNSAIKIYREFSGGKIPRHDEFSIKEIFDIVSRLHGIHKGGGIPLANNVAEMKNYLGTEGLGAAIYQAASNVARAQSASQLAAIFTKCGIFDVAQARPKFRLRLVKGDFSEFIGALRSVQA